jgi:hypothetical protein
MGGCVGVGGLEGGRVDGGEGGGGNLLEELIGDELQAGNFRGGGGGGEEQLEGHFGGARHLQFAELGCHAVHKL